MVKKVMHLLKTGDYSGAENVVFNIMSLDSSEHVYVSPEGRIATILKENDLEYIPIEKFTLLNISKAIKIIKPDIIHAHDITASIIAGVLKYRYPKIKIISHIHNNDPRMRKLTKRLVLYSMVSKSFSEILVVSQSVKNEFYWPHLIDRAIVLSNIVNESIIRRKSEQKTDFYDVLVVGRLTAQKDPMRAISIIEDVKKEVTELRAGFIGEGELKELLERNIKDKKLSKNVDVLGFKDNPYAYMKRAKLLLLTSKYEGFGLVVLESLMLGTPVIATEVGGIPGILTNECGLLTNDSKAMSRRIISITQDKDMRERLSIAAMERARTINNESKFKKILSEVYN